MSLFSGIRKSTYIDQVIYFNKQEFVLKYSRKFHFPLPLHSTFYNQINFTEYLLSLSPGKRVSVYMQNPDSNRDNHESLYYEGVSLDLLFRKHF